MQFAKEPFQRRAVLPDCAAIDDVKRQEQIPIPDGGDQIVEAVPIAGARRFDLSPEGEGFVVELKHGEQVGIVAVFRQERARQRRMARRMSDLYAAPGVRLKCVMCVDQQPEFLDLIVPQPGLKSLQIPLELRNVCADRPLRVPRPGRTPVEIRLISLIRQYALNCD